MSSKDDRMSSFERLMTLRSSGWTGRITPVRSGILRHAALNARRWSYCGIASLDGGGGRRGQGESAGGAERGGAAAREPGGGAGAVVRRPRRVFPGRGQGAGQVR